MSRDFCSMLFKRLHEGFFGDRSSIHRRHILMKAMKKITSHQMFDNLMTVWCVVDARFLLQRLQRRTSTIEIYYEYKTW